MEATITLGSDYVVPEEERLTAARGETYARLLGRLSHQSVVKHFDAYADVDWEAAEFRVDPEDPRCRRTTRSARRPGIGPSRPPRGRAWGSTSLPPR